MSEEPFEVCITVAAMRLGRSLDTLRRWEEMRVVAGVRLDVHRDPLTGIRYFRRSQVEELRRVLCGRRRITMPSGA